MIKNKVRKKDLSKEDKKLILYLLFFAVSSFLYYFAGVINTGFNNLLSNYSFVINEITIPKVGVLIAPIVEESIKLFGYVILFLFSLNFISKLDYNSKKDFLNENLAVAFLISAGGFGFLEGISHNLGFNKLCFIAFIFLNTLIHITYSIYPFILGRRYNNWFVVFLPIAILLHATHNFILEVFWNNKWVTFAMTLIFLVPLLILIRKDIRNVIGVLLPKINKNILLGIFIIIYIYIFLCCLLAF